MDMMCSRCKKRLAVVFMTRLEGDKTIYEGLCLRCAKELGLKPVSDLMEKMGITDDELDNMSDQMMDMFGGEGENGFEMGGAQALPFLQNILGAVGNGEIIPQKPKEEKDSPKEPTVRPAERPKQKERGRRGAPEKKYKHLDAYCDNLSLKAEQGKIDRIIGREREIYRVDFERQAEEQSLPDWRAGRRKDSRCRGDCAEARKRRCAIPSRGQKAVFA